MARTFKWVSMYKEGHPSLPERLDRFHRELIAQVRRDPSGHLLLGIAKDKILYMDVFLGNGQPLIRSFSEMLFLKQVATLDFSGEVSSRDLLAFFLCLQRVRTDDKELKLAELLEREGVRGIGLYPYNYKEVLSRRISGTADSVSSAEREDALWRMLLTENVTSAGAMGSLTDYSIPPQMLASILNRAYAAAGSGSDGTDASRQNLQELLSPEMLRRILGRLEEMFRKLPVDSRCSILLAVGGTFHGDDGGTGEFAPDIVRSLTGNHSEDEFLDLLSAMVAAEGKGGQRLRKVFGVIASERNNGGSLLKMVQGRLGESLRTKNHYARKTWEAVEKLLLGRSEDAYLGRDHSNFLDELSADGTRPGDCGKGQRPPDPALAADFDAEILHGKGAEVLLELLEKEENEGDALELLEEIRKRIPNLVSRKEFSLLQRVLSTLTFLVGTSGESRKSLILGVVEELDFAHLLELYLSPRLSPQDKDRIEEILVSFVELSIEDFLDRLLMEPDKNRRRSLLSLASRFDRRASPAIRKRLADPQWYFVRNVCLMLGGMGESGAAPDLVRLLDHESFQVRQEAIRALGKLRNPDTATFLGKILLHETFLGSTKEETLRIEAANALFLCGGTRAAFFLHRGAETGRTRVKAHCAGILRTMEARR